MDDGWRFSEIGLLIDGIFDRLSTRLAVARRPFRYGSSVAAGLFCFVDDVLADLMVQMVRRRL
jgi:hypothetical protein